VNASIAQERPAHDEIVRLVEKMLALQKERQSVRREDDLDRVRNLERQIAQVDAEIDQRVYALYGLTEEEIKIVEEDRCVIKMCKTYLVKMLELSLITIVNW